MVFGSYQFPTKDAWKPELIKPKQFTEIEIANEESVKKLSGTIGWGAVGSVLLGPVGMLAGLLLGGKSKEVTFVGVLKDGRKLLATTDSKTFGVLQAAVFK